MTVTPLGHLVFSLRAAQFSSKEINSKEEDIQLFAEPLTVLFGKPTIRMAVVRGLTILSLFCSLENYFSSFSKRHCMALCNALSGTGGYALYIFRARSHFELDLTA